jgi:branched-chain amino acid transport system substrate-binding protein
MTRPRPLRGPGRATRARACILALALVLAACAPAAVPTAAPGTPAAAPQPAAGEPIKIGVVTALTTPFALAGVHVKNGVELATEEINAGGGIAGRPIQLIVEDTAQSNTTAVNAFNKVVAEKPWAIVGSIYGTQNLALSPLIEREAVPYFYSSGTVKVSKQGNRWLFGLTPSDELTARGTIRFVVKDLDKKRVAIQYVNNEYGTGALDVLVQTLKQEFHLEPVGVEAHAAEDRDMSAQLLKLKAGNPDVLVVWGHPGDIAVIAKQAVQLGFPRPFVGPSAPLLPSTLQLMQGEETDWMGMVVAWVNGNPDPKVTAFREKYARKFGEPVDFFDAIHYDAMYMLKQAIEGTLPAAGPDPAKVREGIRASLARMTYQGLDTLYAFDAEGRGPHGFPIVRNVDGGKSQEKVGFVRGD